MFGRIRACSSLDCLERPPSKILKDDCLSIYETTLMKLKLGSQQDSSPPIKDDALVDDGETDSSSTSTCNEAVNIIEASKSPARFPKDSPELANSTKEEYFMTLDSDYSITSTTTSTPEASGDCQSKESSTQRKMKNSILYLFSKFKNSPVISTVVEEPMATEDDNLELHSEHESFGSSTVLS